jgi:cytochrome c5
MNHLTFIDQTDIVARAEAPSVRAADRCTAQIANHDGTRTTQIYDRQGEECSLCHAEQIGV